MSDCIFCNIAAGTAPSFKIRENDDFLAFLDGFPNTKGQTLVIPKKHYESDFFLVDDPKFYQDYLVAAKEVVEILKKGLGVHRVAMVMEGMGVDHLHLKLYPLHGLDKERKQTLSNDPKFFETYGGYISSQMGPKADFEEQGALQTQIINGAALK